jgi:TolA-binding protein
MQSNVPFYKIKIYKIIFPFLLFLLNTASIYSQNQLQEGIKNFQKGDFLKAQELFEESLRLNPRNIEAKFYLARLETDGESSVKGLSEFYKNNPTTNLSDQAFLFDLYFNFSKNEYALVLEKFKEFKKLYRKSDFLPQAHWLYASSLLATDQPKLAEKEFRNIIKSHPQSKWSAWAQLGIGDCFFSWGRFAEAVEEYKKVTEKYPSSEALPYAFLGLIKNWYQLGEKEKANFYYNLYKEKFSSGIQGEKDFSQMTSFTQRIKDETIEKLSEVEYTVQVGVFSNKKNADQMSQKFKNKGYKTFQAKKEVNKKSYITVQVGTFDSYEKAQNLKEKLEKEFGENYYVVIK